MNQEITLYSSFYGRPEPFNPNLFGSARGSYNCVIFTDDPHLRVPDGVSVVVDALRGLDPNRASRRAKLMPHRYLDKTDWSIYVDNNVQIEVDPKHLIETLTDRPEFLFATKHPIRGCTYAEADACIHAKKDDPKTIQHQMGVYRDLGFPVKLGLIHGGFLVRRHNHPYFGEFGDHWFEHVLAYSRRDQLSVMFLAWQLGVGIGYLPETYDQRPLFDWPVFSNSIRRDFLDGSAEKRMKGISNMILKGGFFKKLKRRREKVVHAEQVAKDIYADRIGTNVLEDLEGATLLKYEKDGQFEYEAYRKIQSEANRLKFDCQWVGRKQIECLCDLISRHGSMKNHFGICHGTRSGNEQKWFADILGLDVSVIGTDIAESAVEIPNSIQWDFHDENPDWNEKADFVYSNSWDHSYDPKKAFSAWIKSLRYGGLLLIDWSVGHSQKGVTEMDPFGAKIEYLQNMFAVDFKDQGSVIATEKGDVHEGQQIYTIVFRKQLSSAK